MSKNTPKENQEKNDYDAESIKVLKGLEGVRKRPSMYIGTTGKAGLHHLIYEVIDNSIDESLAGFCDRIEIIINNDDSVEIMDNGRGIPIEKHPEYDKYTPEVILETLHSGGKFDNKSYKISGGLHGVGLSVVNALTDWLIVEIKRDGKVYRQKYSKGKMVSAPEINELLPKEQKVSGTKISFYPDMEIFDLKSEMKDELEELQENTEVSSKIDIWDINKIADRVHYLAFLCPSATFVIRNKKKDADKEKFPIKFHFKDGLIDFIKYINVEKKTLYEKPIHFKKNFFLEKNGDKEEIVIEAALQHNKGFKFNFKSFVNTINTIEGGTHERGFKDALNKSIKDYFEKTEPEENDIVAEDTREGVSAIISLMLPDPQFESQTKIKLGNPEIRNAVYQVVKKELENFLEKNPKIAERIVNKVKNAKKARIEAQKARDLIRRKSALGSILLPGKLADCTSKDPTKCELFIVEGDSAGGSAKQGRSREYQAILPLRGKILNVEKSRIHKILSNNEIQAMIKAIGVGLEGLDEKSFDLTKLRYHKIIIMCDADVDGSHIETLLLTFFFRYMRPLIENGHLYIAMPPLYKVNYKKSKQYVYSDKERDKLVQDLMNKYNLNEENKGSIKIQRYKGLGEMNPKELFDTTMNIDTRALLRVKIEQFVEADETFAKLMGEEVEPRKKFITEKYMDVKTLDI